MRVLIAEGVYDGGEKALEIDSAVLVETHVLYGDQGILQHIGDIVDIHPVAVFHSGEGGYKLPVPVVDIACSLAPCKAGDIERRSRVDVCLGDAHDEAENAHAEKHDEHYEYPERVEQHCEEEGAGGAPAAKYAGGLILLLFCGNKGGFFLAADGRKPHRAVQLGDLGPALSSEDVIYCHSIIAFQILIHHNTMIH